MQIKESNLENFVSDDESISSDDSEAAEPMEVDESVSTIQDKILK